MNPSIGVLDCFSGGGIRKSAGGAQKSLPAGVVNGFLNASGASCACAGNVCAVDAGAAAEVLLVEFAASAFVAGGASADLANTGAMGLNKKEMTNTAVVDRTKTRVIPDIEKDKAIEHELWWLIEK